MSIITVHNLVIVLTVVLIIQKLAYIGGLV